MKSGALFIKSTTLVCFVRPRRFRVGRGSRLSILKACNEQNRDFMVLFVKNHLGYFIIPFRVCVFYLRVDGERITGLQTVETSAIPLLLNTVIVVL